MDYEHMLGPDGTEDNLGGTAGFFLCAPKSYFAANGVTEAVTLEDGTTLEEIGENSTDFTFLSGKGWLRVYCTFDKGSLEGMVQGERDGRSYKQVGKAFLPGIAARTLGFMRKAKNDRWVALIPTVDRKWIQMGDIFFDTEIYATKIGTATNSQGVRGSDIELGCMGSGICVYTGTDPLTQLMSTSS
ncbi:MAG: hypothetical protein ACEQSL_05100 [Sediminibacterium sp.]